jgi:hypothetical protein
MDFTSYGEIASNTHNKQLGICLTCSLAKFKKKGGLVVNQTIVHLM